MKRKKPAAPREFDRQFKFRIDDAARDGDGLTLTGYAAVFNTPTRIDSWEGRFDEVIVPGAFTRSIATGVPVLMFEHGKHPLIGTMPLGVIRSITEDAHGLRIEARLSDNWMIEPVRDAIRDRAVTGMSFRFAVAADGEAWQNRAGDVPLRTLTDLDIPELGPVVFAAYKTTTVSVRSHLERMGADSRAVPDDMSFNDVSEAVCDAVAAKLALPEYVSPWIIDVSDTWAIYSLNYGDEYWKVAYSMDDSGVVTIDGDPMPVEQETTWVPATDEGGRSQPVPAAASDARSADGGTATPGNDGVTPAAPAAPDPKAAARDRELRLRGVIR